MLPVLIPYIQSGDGGRELRYALRSLSNLWDWNGEVYIVGDREDWFRNINYIKAPTVHQMPVKDVENKVYAALTTPDFPSDFIYMNDDMYITGEAKLTTLHRGELSGTMTTYHQRLNCRTAKWLISRGIKDPLNYEVHAPMIMNRDKRLEVHEHIKASNYGMQARSLYGNLFNLGGDYYDDRKSKDSILKQGLFISTQNYTDELKKLFPKKSKLE